MEYAQINRPGFSYTASILYELRCVFMALDLPKYQCGSVQSLCNQAVAVKFRIWHRYR